MKKVLIQITAAPKKMAGKKMDKTPPMIKVIPLKGFKKWAKEYYPDNSIPLGLIDRQEELFKKAVGENDFVIPVTVPIEPTQKPEKYKTTTVGFYSVRRSGDRVLTKTVPVYKIGEEFGITEKDYNAILMTDDS